MNRCPKCGFKFEGKFCPNCGTKWEEKKICPSCGTKLDGAARFCNECGYSFALANNTKEKTNKKQDNGKKNTVVDIYGILKYIPALLFGLFSVLLFIFYAMPVAVLPAQEFMGEKIPSESYGNVYSMYSGILSEIPELKGAMLTLILLAVFALLYAIVDILVIFLPKTKWKKINILGKFKITIVKFLSLISFVIYLMFFIIGCVVCGKITAMDEGMEILAAGSCPILLIVFSLIFALLGISAFVVRFVLRKNNPALAKIEAKKEKAQAKAERQRKKEFYEIYCEPLPPKANSDKKTYKKQVCIYKHECRRYKKAKEGRPSDVVIWLDLHKITISVALVVIITVTCILISKFVNNFEISKIRKIELGFTHEQVRDILGEPYEKTMTDYCWQYFDDNYINVLDKLSENSKEQEKVLFSGNESKLMNLIEKEEKLKAQLESMTYKYIEINFSQVSNKENNYVVSSVYFEPNKCDSNLVTNKELNYVELSAKNSIGYYVDKTGAEEQNVLISYEDGVDLYYSSYYTDGSFYRDYLTNATTQINGEYATIKWTDRFTSYEKVNKAIEIGIVSESGVWTTTYKDVVALRLPERVRVIDKEAFSGCENLTSITIGRNVNSIAKYAFYGCRTLTSVNITDLSAWCDIKFDGYSSNPLNYAHSLYLNGKLVTDLVIPNGVTSISSLAFLNCTSLTSVSIPNSVTSIGDCTFSGCTSLTSITIPDTVTSIDNEAFNGCTNLTSITIPNSVTSIGDSAFLLCTSLTSVYYHGTADEWKKIIVDTNNSSFTSATVYYYSETEPTKNGNYWHYVDGVPTAW